MPPKKRSREELEEEDELRCNICLEVMQDAVQTECCGNGFCSTCLETAVSIKRTCPTCRSDDVQSLPDPRMKRRCAAQMHPCPHDGCAFRGNRAALAAHNTEFLDTSTREQLKKLRELEGENARLAKAAMPLALGMSALQTFAREMLDYWKPNLLQAGKDAILVAMRAAFGLHKETPAAIFPWADSYCEIPFFHEKLKYTFYVKIGNGAVSFGSSKSKTTDPSHGFGFSIYNTETGQLFRDRFVDYNSTWTGCVRLAAYTSVAFNRFLHGEGTNAKFFVVVHPALR